MVATNARRPYVRRPQQNVVVIDALTHLNRLLVGRYRLDREIGRGGMATVYLASEEKHHRRVALKVLSSAYDIAHDGRILGLPITFNRMRIVATTNWVSELRARLAGAR